MTVIAWDGKVLAADKRATIDNVILSVTKIFRFEDCLYGFCGNLVQSEKLFEWIKSGSGDKLANDDCNEVVCLKVNPDKTLEIYQGSSQTFRIHDKRHAIGSGASFAVMAMKCGKGAAKAVEATFEYDCSCGGGVDTLMLV